MCKVTSKLVMNTDILQRMRTGWPWGPLLPSLLMVLLSKELVMSKQQYITTYDTVNLRKEKWGTTLKYFNLFSLSNVKGTWAFFGWIFSFLNQNKICLQTIFSRQKNMDGKFLFLNIDLIIRTAYCFICFMHILSLFA